MPKRKDKKIYKSILPKRLLRDNSSESSTCSMSLSERIQREVRKSIPHSSQGNHTLSLSEKIKNEVSKSQSSDSNRSLSDRIEITKPVKRKRKNTDTSRDSLTHIMTPKTKSITDSNISHNSFTESIISNGSLVSRGSLTDSLPDLDLPRITLSKKRIPIKRMVRSSSSTTLKEKIQNDTEFSFKKKPKKMSGIQKMTHKKLSERILEECSRSESSTENIVTSSGKNMSITKKIKKKLSKIEDSEEDCGIPKDTKITPSRETWKHILMGTRVYYQYLKKNGKISKKSGHFMGITTPKDPNKCPSMLINGFGSTMYPLKLDNIIVLKIYLRDLMIRKSRIKKFYF